MSRSILGTCAAYGCVNYYKEKCCLVFVPKIHLLVNGSSEYTPFQTILINLINTSYGCFYLAPSNLLYCTFSYGTGCLSIKVPVNSGYLCCIWMCYYTEIFLVLVPRILFTYLHSNLNSEAALSKPS